VTSAPQRNLTQKILNNAQDFLPSAIANPPWQLSAGLLPVLNASDAARRLFRFDYRHTMVGLKTFVATFKATPQNVVRRFHYLFCEAGSGESVRAEIVVLGQISGTWSVIVAERDSGSVHENFLGTPSGGGDYAPNIGYFDIPPGAFLRLTSKGPLPATRILDFGFMYEELAAPAIFEQQEIPVTVVEV